MTVADFNPLTQLPSLSLPGVLEVVLLPTDTRYSVRLRVASLPVLAETLGFALPQRMGDIASSGQIKAICVGPDEWILSAPQAAGEDLGRKLRAAADIVAMSFVEISDRACSLRVTGPKAAYAIKAVCPHDVAAMPVNTSTRTLFEQADVLVEREGEMAFRLEVLRSWSVHVASLLAVIGREIATGL